MTSDNTEETRHPVISWSELDRVDPFQVRTRMITGVACHRSLPDGEEFGCFVPVGSETWIVTKRELDRILNMPSTAEAAEIVRRFEEWRHASKMQGPRTSLT